MEGARKRSLVKSIVWRIICIIVSIFTTLLLTGRWDIAVAVGSIYNAVTMFLYYLHERFWNRINWGIEQGKSKKTIMNPVGDHDNLKKTREEKINKREPSPTKIEKLV